MCILHRMCILPQAQSVDGCAFVQRNDYPEVYKSRPFFQYYSTSIGSLQVITTWSTFLKPSAIHGSTEAHFCSVQLVVQTLNSCFPSLFPSQTE